ncbi:MAG: TIGR02300 family protein [Alphaproteobacteria bacterium]|nr:MAG: TIGR02300 family protein [Alphaproteobacteria bacterium]
MAKEKWGTKRTCPKCATRFYDLGKGDPIVCIECGNEWVPEPILKSRSPHLEEAKKPIEKATEAVEAEKVEDDPKEEDADLPKEEDADLPKEEDEANPDNDLDLGDDNDVAAVIETPKKPDEGG